MRRTRIAPTALLTGCVLLLGAGCQSRARDAVQAPPTAAAPVTASPSAAPVPSPTATAAPSPTASPTPARPTYDVKAVQARLTALKYYVAGVDGVPGGALASAVMAFQKVNGLGADGTVGPLTLAALKTPEAPVLRGTGGGTRVEVDLTKQVLYVVTDGRISRIMPVSSGSGRHYLTRSGATAIALSPVGHYVVQRRYVGPQRAPLGILYDPQYFYEGWAIHGSDSVPAYPASHGCIRVTRPDAKYLLGVIGVGTPVYVYGGTFTFPAGSSAPGTTDPGGDTPDAPAPTPTPVRPSATPRPTPSATPSPSPSASPSPSPLLPSP